MKTIRFTTLATVATLLVLISLSAAQWPFQMNYQVMLTDNADQPLANESVQLVFRIYDVPAQAARQLWTETHNVATNSIGVASVCTRHLQPSDHRLRWTAVAPGRGRRGDPVTETRTDQRPLRPGRSELGRRALA